MPTSTGSCLEPRVGCSPEQAPERPFACASDEHGTSVPRRPRVLYLVTEDWYFTSHRLPTARLARDLGWEVVVATNLDRHADAIRAEGFRPVHVPSLRRPGGPLRQAARLIRLIRLYRREAPDLVHHIALVPAVFGAAAALAAGTRRSVATLTGLGFAFASDRPRARLLRMVLRPVLRLLLSRPGSHVVFQNADDRDLFDRLKLVPPDRSHLIRGSGVDIVRFPSMPEPGGTVTAIFVGRFLRDKGVAEVAEAARLLRAQGAPVRIVLVGKPDSRSPGSLTEADIRAWERENLLEWWGHRSDIADVWRGGHIALLPSYRGEGLPKSLLEAASCGRPMIATDVPGCREIVVPSKTGFLVPPRDAAALADAIARLAADGALRRRMGEDARRSVERDFCDAVIQQQTRVLYEAIMTA